ncbi:MAG: hypothetical protein MPK31_09280 [Gammaproteobacteria bacterium]|nr:hypothetical protein [Gammaproteobacteria bacterium]
MKVIAKLFLVASLFTSNAYAMTLLVNRNAEFLRIECRDDGLHFSFTLQGNKSCDDYSSCIHVDARVSGEKWERYSAHNSFYSFVRNQNDTFQKSGAPHKTGASAEQLLEKMLSASFVEMKAPAMSKQSKFDITEGKRAELQEKFSQCGKLG